MRVFNKILAFSLILLMLIPTGLLTASVLSEKNESSDNIKGYTIDKSRITHPKYSLKPIDKRVISSPPSVAKSTPERYIVQGITWTNPPGTWWDTDWEYRINVTVTEPNIADRTNWPIDVYVTFDPPAFKYSIRVIEVSATGLKEIPSQIWDVTYHNTTHLSSAYVTFLVNISRNQAKVYQIYWSTDYTDPPVYAKRVRILTQTTPSGDVYIIESLTAGWSVKLPPENGGKAKNVTLPSGDEVGHTWLHFGVTRNTTLDYEGYWGTGDTNNRRYTSRVIVEETDPLLSIYEGVIFITYKVSGIPLYDSIIQDDVAKVNYVYRFFDWGIVVQEEITWLLNDAKVDYFIAGWVFDQDDGIGAQSTFDKVGSDAGIEALPEAYVYPILSGTLSGNFSKKIYPGQTYPLIRVHRVYLSAGSHTISAESLEKSLTGPPWTRWADSPGLIIYAPDGTYITSGNDGADGNNDGNITLTFTASVSGYYFAVVYQFDDEGGTAGATYYDFSVDGSIVASNIWVSNTGTTFPYDSIILFDLEITSSTQNIIHDIELSWGTADDLDLYLYGPSSNAILAGYSSATTKPETISFNATDLGHWSIVVHKYNSSTLSTSFRIIITAHTGPEFFDDYGTGNLNDIAFFHSSQPRGIGMTILDENIPGTYSSIQMLWYNEGNDSEIDYIFWARWIKNLTVSAGQVGSVKYAIIPWYASGTTDAERYSGFNQTCYNVKYPLQYSLSSIERFKILVTVFIKDKDGEGIASANVTFYNSTGIKEYSALTNAQGKAVFDVLRKWWNITVVFSSGGITYENYTIVDFSNSATYNYTVHSTTKTIFLSKIVRVIWHAFTSESPPNIIQNGYILLDSSINSLGLTLTISGYTNLSGIFDIYLPYGSWTIRFNKSVTTPEDYDNITIYSDSSLTSNITGYGRSHTLNIQSGATYYIRDWEYPLPGVTIVKTELVVTTTPSPLDLYWKQEFSVDVQLKNETGALINGTIYWKIYDTKGVLWASGSGSTNRDTFSFTYNTSNLDAGINYILRISATVTETKPNTEFLKPAPIEKVLIAKVRPISLDVYFYPATAIYWNESLKIEVDFFDALDSTKVGNATITAKIIGEGILKTHTLTETDIGHYVLYLANFSYDSGTYSVIISASRKNYEGTEKVYSLVIYERPTDLNAPTYIEIPWQESYTIGVSYIDTRYDVFITDANVTFIVKDQADNTLLQRSMTEETEQYTVTLNLTNIPEGVYTIEIHANKRNFESKETSIVLKIRVRETSVTTEATKLTVIYGDMITLKVHYEDADFDKSILGATATFTITGVDVSFGLSGNLLDFLNGTYLFNISSVTIGKHGTFTIDIELRKMHYQTQSITITLIINSVPTFAYAQPANVTLYWGEVRTIMIFYNASTTNMPVDGANISFNVLDIHGAIIDVPENAFVTERKYGVFLIHINSSLLSDSTIYILNVTLSKSHYETKSVLIFIRVNPIPANVIVTPHIADIVWGDTFNFSISVINLIDGSGIDGITIVKIVYVGGEGVRVGTAIEIIPIGGGEYRIIIRSGMLNVTDYNIFLIMTKPHYALPTVNVTARINPVSVVVSIKTSKSVFKNPATGEATTHIEITLREKETGAPATGATIKVLVMRGETVISEILAEELEENPGVYIAYIDWSKMEPGDYTIRVRIEEMQRKGYSAPADMTLNIAGGEVETGVSVDYLGGSTVIAGRRYPNLLVYPPLVAVLFLIGFIGYKYYAWYHLPIEVREIIQLLKKIQKGEYVYEAPTREEVFREIIMEQVKLY